MIQPDRRSVRRHEFQIPILIKRVGPTSSEGKGLTADVSSGGLFLHASDALAEGTEIEFAMVIPEEITLSESLSVICKGFVVRVGSKGGKQGSGVRILGCTLADA